MIPAKFDYARPSTVEEAVQALAAGGDDPKVIAGGQSFIPVLRLRLAAPSTVVDISSIEELHQVASDGDRIRIGSMVTHAEILDNPVVAEHLQLLHQVTETVADRQVRHRGTLGGALAHADPAGDLGSAAVALEAEFEIAGPDGRRTVSAADFFVDYLTTAIAENEVLVSTSFPRSGDFKTHYEKFNRMAQGWATVGSAVAVKVDGGTISEARVGLTNMGSVPIRATGVESALVGKAVSAEAIREAAEHADEGTSPTDDLSAKADYRRHLAKVLTRRALEKALGLTQ